jgi:RHS repeat-associated protein
LSLIAILDLIAQSVDKNYIKTSVYLDNTETSALKTVHYFDGLGRPVQTVQQNVGPANNNQDLITVQEYDYWGRESKTWLPLYRTSNTGNYYGGIIPNDAKSQYGNDAFAYSEILYEASPLNRIRKQYGPGQAWRTGSGHPVATDYLVNNASYPCGYFYVSGDNLVSKGYYANGSLTVTKTTDEDGNISYEFTDKWNRVVLQRQMNKTIPHNTYLVYDDRGNLRFVLPPAASDSLLTLAQTTYNPSANTALKNYAYIYKYDHRKRCTEKKLPGADPVFYVYDKADRLIFYQDGEQRSDSSWVFIKYDASNRIILTGVWKKSRKTQANLVSQFQNTFATEGVSTAGAYGYTWNTLSGVSGSMVLQANYYDNSDNFLNTLDAATKGKVSYATLSGYDTRYANSSFPLTWSKGLLVGTRVKMLDDTSKEIVTAFYYNAKGRVVQQKSTNLQGGSEAEYVAYSFTGKPKKTQKVHTATGKPAITEVYTYAYDHADRLTTTKYKLDNNAEITLSTLSYDNFGRVNEKKLHGGKETIAYTYNIRSWLKTINSAHFNEKLYYHESYAGNVTAYNGNISTTYSQWTISEREFFMRGYVYTYDGLNRLTKAQYFENSTKSSFFNEELVYDKQGNIIELKRNAPVSPGSTTYTTEQLYLHYTGNQLKATGTQPGVFTAATLNTYNKNGSMTAYSRFKIPEIRYNVLNLPDKIKFGVGHTIQNSYDALGVKRKTEHITVENRMVVGIASAKDVLPSALDAAIPTSSPASSSASSSSSAASAPAAAIYATVVDKTVTDYCGNIIYENGNLKYILNPEGYVTKSGSTPVYNYYLKDHLGNNRVVTSVNGSNYTVIQKTDYYPFGKPYPDALNPERQPYKFGGKEYDEMHGLNWYDFHARYYSDIILSFLTMDPMAEKYYWISPYAYCLNNPVRFTDPFGMDVWEINNLGEITKHIKDKTQDAFYMVAKDADGNYQRTFTTDMDGNKNYNSISFEYGTVTSVQEKNVKTDVGDVTLTMFNIKGDAYATQLFEFMSNPGVTTNVEWSHDKIGTEKSEKNVVGTIHLPKNTVQGYYLSNKGYTIREDNHSHPGGTEIPSPGDKRTAAYILEKNPRTLLNIYIPQKKKYIPYNASGSITK